MSNSPFLSMKKLQAACDALLKEQGLPYNAPATGEYLGPIMKLMPQEKRYLLAAAAGMAFGDAAQELFDGMDAHRTPRETMIAAKASGGMRNEYEPSLQLLAEQTVALARKSNDTLASLEREQVLGRGR